MGTPLLAALRAAYPDAHLTWIVEQTEVQAIDANPFIDEYLVWNSAFWKNMLRRGLYPLWVWRCFQMRKLLREKQYDIFISFQPEEWPLLLRGVGAAVTVGIFDTFRRFHRNTATSRYTRLYSQAYSHPNLPEHRIDQYLLTLQALGLPSDVSRQMSIGYTQEDEAKATRFLAEANIAPGERFALLAPFTTWPTKCWPSAQYAELGNALAAHLGCRIILVGSRKEASGITAIAAQMEVSPAVAAGTLSFREMAALADKAALIVSGDTGPLHVAAALQKPQVALFGPTSPSWYGPISPQAISLLHPVPCGPCDQKYCPNSGDDFEKCLRLVTVSEALTAATSLLSRPPADAASGRFPAQAPGRA